MKEVIDAIQGLYEDLEKQHKNMENRLAAFSKKFNELAEKETVLAATQNRLSALERLYKKYDDFEKEKKEFDAKVNDLNERVRNAQTQEDNDAAVLKQIQEENARLDERKAAMSKQALAHKEKEADFDKKRKELQAIISGEAVRNLLK